MKLELGEKMLLLVMSMALYDSLMYPFGFLSQLQWHYDRCKLVCTELNETSNSTWCTARNESVHLFPMHKNDDKVFAPQFLWMWVYETPVEDVVNECRRLVG